MQRLTGIMLVAIVCTAMLTGCALRDSRTDYAYSGAADGLWGDTAFELIDWNFPTSHNQGPIEAPKRFRLERTAIGVPWATRNPLPLADNLAPYDTPPTAAVKADEGKAAAIATVGTAGARPVPVDSERRGVR